MRIKLRLFVLVPILTAFLLPVVAEPSAPEKSTSGDELSTSERITHAAKRFMDRFAEEQKEQEREVTYELGSVDKRLSLTPCPNPLDVSFAGDPERTTRATLLIACKSDQPWRLFLNTSVEIIVEGWVSAQPIGRAQRLRRDMLEKSEVVINKRRRSGFRNPDHMLGMETKRAINAGIPITPDMLREPDAVERGDRVVISANNDTFSIETRGEAMSDGQVGEQVSVVNEKSGRRIRGRITGPGRVTVSP